MGAKKKPSQSLDELRGIIRVLLEDHSQVYQGGESLPSFEEKGPPGPTGFPLNASAIRRYFQDRPEEMDNVGRYFLDHAEADSHLWLEGKMREFRSRLPELAAPVDDVHFRSTAGTKDADWYLRVLKRKAEAGDWAAESTIWRYNRCIDLLAMAAQTAQQWADGPDLYATVVKRKAIREAEKMEEKHKEYYFRFRDLTDPETGEGKKIGDAYKTLEIETGIGRRRLEQIISSQREQHGEEPRRQGRPKREERKGA